MRWCLFKTDAKRTKQLFDTLTDLSPMKESDFRLFPTLLANWESELTKFEKMDAEYALGKHNRRQILYKSLPASIQTVVDQEEACNRLNTYEDFRRFLITLASSSEYAQAGKPKPLLGNVDAENPESPEGKTRGRRRES